MIPHGGPLKGYMKCLVYEEFLTLTHHGIRVPKCKTIQKTIVQNHKRSKDHKHLILKLMVEIYLVQDFVFDDTTH
jgi:hypothetical protein